MATLNEIYPTLLKSKSTYRHALADEYLEAGALDSALACEHYFFIASVASATYLTKRGLLDAATAKLKDDRDFWVSQLRRIAKEQILGDDPERFPFDSYVEALPGMKRDTQERIPALQRLVARNAVLQGYIAQYDLLRASGLTPSECGTQVAQVESTVVVLAPPAAT